MREALLLIGGIGSLLVGWWFLSAPGPAGMTDLGRAQAAVQATPADPAVWLALGDAQAAVDAHHAAEYAYHRAIQLADAQGQPDGQARARLGFLLFGRGRDNEARRWLKEAQARGATTPLLEETLMRLTPAPRPRAADAPASAPTPAAPTPRVDGGATELDAAGSPAPEEVAAAPFLCTVQLERRASGALLAMVWINQRQLVLLVDTGATISVINRSAAEAVGVAPVSGRLQAVTANGVTEMTMGWVDEIILGDRLLEGVRVAVCEECVSAVADGLLGVDLQSRFDVRVDVVAGLLLFADCD